MALFFSSTPDRKISSSPNETDTRSFVPRQRPPMLSLPLSVSFSSHSRDAPTALPLRPRTVLQESSSQGVIYGEASRRGKRRVHREDRSIFLPFITRSGCMARIDNELVIEGGEIDMPISVFGVFDGHGGQRAAEFASMRLPQILLDMCAKSNDCVEVVLRKAFLKTDEEFLKGRRGNRDGKSFTSRQGSTGANVSRKSLAGATGDSSQTPDRIRRAKSGSRLMSVALQRAGSYNNSAAGKGRNFELSRSVSLHRYELSSDGSSILTNSQSSLQGSPPPKISGLTPMTSAPLINRSVPPTLARSKSKAEYQISEFSATSNPTCGTTATVVLLFGDEMNIAYVGDSRAVVSVCGKAVRMGEDHRPAREDEGERIEKAGGLILCVGGTERVNGILAVSRAIGDQGLKDYVVAEPELFRRKLIGEEELFIVASDGLWDFVTDQESVDLARAVLSQGNSMMEMAAKELVALACERGSTDDVSVVVVDMRDYWKRLETKDLGSSTDDTVVEEGNVIEIKLDGNNGIVNFDKLETFRKKSAKKSIPKSKARDKFETAIGSEYYDPQLEPSPTPRHKVKRTEGW